MEFVGFWEIIEKGGPVMWPLLLISLAAVAFGVERIIAFNQFGSLSPGLTDEIIQLVRAGRWRDAHRRTDEMPGPVAATLATVLETRDQALEDIEREASVTGEDYFIRLERFLPALDTFTTLSPLLGLLGTILGMVKVFQQFTSSASEEGKAAILAGVGESLYATAFGIAIAIFCFAVYNFFTSRQRRISIETDQAMTRLMTTINELRSEAIKRGEMQPIPTSKKKRVTEKYREMKKTKVEIIPMIDTMFFLLVFFILSSVGIIKLSGLPVKLPDAKYGDPQEPAQITISIATDGRVKVNALDVGQNEDIGPFMIKEVKRQVGNSNKAADIATAHVVVNADAGVPNGEVVHRINQARVAGVSKFTVATNKVQENGSAP
jgi:biopolymer transport protein ExbB/TolQ/biopolymer transport protein ExbD